MGRFRPHRGSVRSVSRRSNRRAGLTAGLTADKCGSVYVAPFSVGYPGVSMNDGKTSFSKKTEILILLIILSVGATVRLLYLNEIRIDPGLEVPPVDAGFNLYWARGWATGDWELPPDANGRDPLIRETAFQRPPGYPFVLSVLYRLADGNALAIRMLQMVGGMLAVVLAWLVGRRFFSRAVGLVWAGLMAVHWAFVYFEGGLNGTWLLSLLFLMLVAALGRFAETARWTNAAQIGAVVGLTTLVRSNALLLGIALGAWICAVAVRRSGWKAAGAALAAAVTAGALVLVPATWRNFTVSGYLVPSSANAGLALYQGNNPGASGISSAAAGGAGHFASPWHSSDLMARVSARAGRKVGFAEASRDAGKAAREWISKHPARALKLTGDRALMFWGPCEMAHSTPVAADREASAVLRWWPFGFSVVAAGAFWGVGIWLFAGRRLKADGAKTGTREVVTAVAAVVLTWFVSFLPFWVTSLYRMTVVPALLLFASLGVVATADALRAGKTRFALTGLAVLVLLSAGLSVPVIEVDPGTTERLVLRGSQWRMKGDREQAEEAFRQALRSDPESPRAQNGLAAVLLDSGRYDEAIPLLEAAVRTTPSDPAVHFNLGLAHFNAGHWGPAVESFRKSAELAPNLGQAQALLGISYRRLGLLEPSVRAYERALELEPDRADVCNELAWILSTAREEDLRDGDKAVEVARRAVAGLRTAATLDTYAAALAEAGRFEEAVAVMDEAVEVNRREPTVPMENLENRRTLYLSGVPFRDPDL